MDGLIFGVTFRLHLQRNKFTVNVKYCLPSPQMLCYLLSTTFMESHRARPSWKPKLGPPRPESWFSQLLYFHYLSGNGSIWLHPESTNQASRHLPSVFSEQFICFFSFIRLTGNRMNWGGLSWAAWNSTITMSPLKALCGELVSI